jgi:hypothetical protein
MEKTVLKKAMKLTVLICFIYNITYSQDILADWKKFQDNSKWKVYFKKNDSINENRPYIGELIFEPKVSYRKDFISCLSLSYEFFVFQPDMQFNSDRLNVREKIIEIFFSNDKNVFDKFEFNKHKYLLSSFQSASSFKNEYISFVKEIEIYIKK